MLQAMLLHAEVNLRKPAGRTWAASSCPCSFCGPSFVQLPFLVPAALPLRTTADAEGITGKAYTTERVPFCRKLLQLALQAGVLQLQAPRQSGKTSTLQLATRQLPWLQKQHPGLKIQLIAVSMLPKETLDNALERSYPGRFPGGWRSLISKPPFTGTGGQRAGVSGVCMLYTTYAIRRACHMHHLHCLGHIVSHIWLASHAMLAHGLSKLTGACIVPEACPEK
jgi:hypothetical protein